MTERTHRFACTLIAVASLSIAAPTAGSEAELSKQILKQDGWVSYQVPMVADAGAPCCYEIHGKHVAHAGCDLDGRSWTSGTIEGAPIRADGTLALYLHVQNAQVDKVSAFAASCPVRGAEQARRIEAVNGADSVAWLAQAITHDEKFTETADSELAALAMHEDTTATSVLSKFSDASHSRKLREQALFWSGQMRGASGAQVAERVAVTDADPDMRAHAVFVLSQSSAIDGYASIHKIAQTDASGHVREQALFWMAQTGDARAKKDILAAIDKDPSDDVREQAVFALSQLKDHEADTALIELVRGNYPRKVKEQALFWLGESGSDAAINFLDEVLTSRAQRSHET